MKRRARDRDGQAEREAKGEDRLWLAPLDGPEIWRRTLARWSVRSDLELVVVPAADVPALRAGEPPAAPSPIHRLTVPQAGGGMRLLPVTEIDWIEAADQYVSLHVGGRRHLVRDSMARLEIGLDPRRFLRIHRSAIVHLDRVVELHAESSRSRWLVLRGGERLRVSPRRWEVVVAALLALP